MTYLNNLCQFINLFSEDKFYSYICEDDIKQFSDFHCSSQSKYAQLIV